MNTDPSNNFSTCPPGGAAGDKTEAGQTVGGFGSNAGGSLETGVRQPMEPLSPIMAAIQQDQQAFADAFAEVIEREVMQSLFPRKDDRTRMLKMETANWRREPDGPSDHEPIDRKQTRHHVYP